jgi:myosin heavy subunit
VAAEARAGCADGVLQGASMPASAQQLGVAPPGLEKVLTSRSISTATESVQKILDPEGAGHARDALAKSLYGKLFLWIVAKANTTIHSDAYASSIGVLDIFGFEILGKNGFEQLCINYTNEKLHQLFIEQTLRGEQQVYKDEGIKWEPVAFFDNKPIIELVERNGGLFALVNEESIFPKGSDISLHAKLKTQIRDKEFTTPAKGAASEFQLKHYAGAVNYDTSGMLDRNKDHLFADMVRCCC